MDRVQIFAFRVSNEERRFIAELAVQLQRSQSDAVRFVVIEAARQLSELHVEPVPPVGARMQGNKWEGIDVSG